MQITLYSYQSEFLDTKIVIILCNFIILFDICLIIRYDKRKFIPAINIFILYSIQIKLPGIVNLQEVALLKQMSYLNIRL